ncbi:helix-turn-helix domain-containing protein [Actinosynnema mirum]|uniref:Transcriptional regulator, XRE family n=1 Tax=Actinosynnema mirum (strain ATCC 29888 / DSM 43827 / JCM 3225 / NBRC 14064 / NCIMB 13271 / NRRL B-12336 / IMRU 3971 / 101) TaxID=446462 RepID=C6WL17_ACTMD|nr:helix-turn-helix transcriptional regulator [Actinosynnema mirum]ACU36370.1 transcriptional regulator, XRE family [Actinosynnema mirum DSM 43827]
MSTPAKKAQGLGAQLRVIRKRSGLSMKEVADRMGWSEAKVSRMETGKRPVDSEEVSGILAIFKIVGVERERLMAMARTPEEPAWIETIRAGLPNESVTLATYENEAVSITNWSPLLVPGLLQTMETASAFMQLDGIPDHDIGARLMGRSHRQRMLERVHYTAIIDETVLHRRLGDAHTHRAQLRHLVAMAERERVAIRLIPVNSASHSALISPFMLLEFDHQPPIVHVELSRSGAFFVDPAETDIYVRQRAQLLSVSMDEADSVRLIQKLIEEKGP